ncbi:hypothetical protein ACLIKD_08910 [Azonexus sp. IMCC34842]|uniref:hypothetical protein n=1 Tax=Azonexus sp. IMCC34842 TaxID=3420950 RepID=UPI003D127019
MKQGIVDRPFSRRSDVHACQVELFVLLARELIDAYRRRPDSSLADWFEIPEYQRFVIGAYAAGFVCTDLEAMNNFEEMGSRPRDHLSGASFSKLRHYVHTLLRAERWADGYASTIREAIVSGALGIVVDRLDSDDSLKQQEELVDEVV